MSDFDSLQLPQMDNKAQLYLYTIWKKIFLWILNKLKGPISLDLDSIDILLQLNWLSET